ncbi:MAG: hypothetical protein LC754_10585 [Acidobacteria bacterium]|nr:hypothetical protein [Acidobacteriota bacterium]
MNHAITCPKCGPVPHTECEAFLKERFWMQITDEREGKVVIESSGGMYDPDPDDALYLRHNVCNTDFKAGEIKREWAD